MISSKKKKKTNENQEAVCSGLISVAGFCMGGALDSVLDIEHQIKTNLGVKWNILSWNERWNDGGGKGEERKLGPHEPTLVEVERLEAECSKGVDVPIAVNDPSAKQNPDKVGVGEVRDF